MYSESENITIIIIVGLWWLIVGLCWAYLTRDSSCLIKIIVAIVCTKGFLLFWIIYFPYLLIKNAAQGMKDENTKQQQNDQKENNP